jgi:hypothetical protein
MSLHEKSAWACLASTLLIWGAYFALVFSLPAEMFGIALPAAIGAIVLQAVVMIVASIAFAVMHRGAGIYDERDRSIALRSGHWAGWVLSVGVCLCVVFFPMREIALQMDPPGDLASGSLAGPFTTANILLVCFVFSEVVHYGAQVVLYRRG